MALKFVDVDGNLLYLGTDKDPPVGHRVGSVSLHFDNGSRVIMKVYGSVKIYSDSHERDKFELQLREICANPQTITTVLGLTGQYAKAKRFNPSNAQKDRGWYTASKACNEKFHERCI
jgi:hypothetical protein